MNLLFYIAAAAAVISTLMMVIRRNAVHSLLYLIASLFSVSVVMFITGSPFVAALEVIIYAGAIMVLFIFVIMMLDVGEEKKKNDLKEMKTWIVPGLIALLLLAEMVYMIWAQTPRPLRQEPVLSAAVARLMFSKYVLIVELAAFLLMAGIIGAYHLGMKDKRVYHRYLKNKNQNR